MFYLNLRAKAYISVWIIDLSEKKYEIILREKIEDVAYG